MRIATIDVGTNTCLLLVAEVGAGRMVPVYHEGRFVRLGEGVDAERRLRPAAMERVLNALRAYKAKADELGATEVIIGATSASRDAANLPELQARVRHELGLEYRTLSGEEEAIWSFRGACSAYASLQAASVIDIGGGSTEVVSGPVTGPPPQQVSVDVGSVRLTERFFSSLPPSPEELAAAEAFTVEAFAAASPDPSLPLLGSSGTTRALAQLVRPEAPGRAIPAAVVRLWRQRLAALSAEEVLALNPTVLSGRADVFLAGVLILDVVLQRFGIASMHASPRGLRHGLALRWLAEHNGTL